ncbi:MAG TPA: alkaline phosphatase family protein [Thermodesulfobacteriota bacterium]
MTPRARLACRAVVPALLAACAAAGPASAAPRVPRYDHVFVIVEENRRHDAVIGNPAAPTINHLAGTYGLATRYYGVVRPSQGNYVAMLAGSFFGIRDNRPHVLDRESLVDQLDAAGISWKGYFQSIPSTGFLGACAPEPCTPSSGLYVAKHNPFVTFDGVRSSDRARRRLVSDGQLFRDLESGRIPRFALIVPDQCHDMHGAPPHCAAPTTAARDARLLRRADDYVARVVGEIMASRAWADRRTAIVITWDEGTTTSGCCGADPGGGRIPTIVVTSRGPRGVRDATPYNHYSLLASIERAFGLECLRRACDAPGVQPMARLFADRQAAGR